MLGKLPLIANICFDNFLPHVWFFGFRPHFVIFQILSTWAVPRQFRAFFRVNACHFGGAQFLQLQTPNATRSLGLCLGVFEFLKNIIIITGAVYKQRLLADFFLKMRFSLHFFIIFSPKTMRFLKNPISNDFYKNFSKLHLFLLA